MPGTECAVRGTKGEVVPVFPTVPLRSAHLQLVLWLVLHGWRAGNLRKDSPFLSAGAVKARCLGWGDSAVFSPGAGTRLLESSHPTRCGSTVDMCGILFHGAQNCQLQTLQHKRKKNKQESQKEMALPGQRPGSQRDKTHTARGDELLVTADLKSAWYHLTLQLPSCRSERHRNNFGHK